MYYRKDRNQKLDNDLLKHCKGISELIADQKVLVIERNWNYFFGELLKAITNHPELKDLLYDKQEEFYAENVSYRQNSSLEIRSNKIKKILYAILTQATFENEPCKLLLNIGKNTPQREKWEEQDKFLALGAEPFHNVSEFTDHVQYFEFSDNIIHCRYLIEKAKVLYLSGPVC